MDHSIDLPSGRTLDPGRRRSDGPLDREEFETCRTRRIPLAYDPAQIGWVTAGCRDDLDRVDPTRIAPTPARTLAAMQAELDRRSHEILRSRATGGVSREEAAAAIWRCAEEVVAEHRRAQVIPKGLQRVALDLLHERAAALLQSQLVAARDRGARRAHCTRLAERYRLRPWQASDLERFVELLDNPNVWRYLPEDPPSPLSQETARSLVELANEGTHHEVRAIEREGEVVGQVRLELGRHASRRDAEISYWLGEPYWGLGIATDAVMLFTHLAFENHELDSVFARIHRNHAASARLIEKAGYRFEGRLRSELDAEPEIHVHRVYRGDYARTTPARVVPLFGTDTKRRA